MNNIINNKTRGGVRILAIVLSLILILTTVFSSGLILNNKIDIASAAEDLRGTPYPWSERKTTGNFIHDSFPQISVSDSSRFENVSTERLFDILKSKTPVNNAFYILFGGPHNEATQQIIGTVNDKAKAAGINKIYLFNPVLDDYQLDITDSTTTTSKQGQSLGNPVNKYFAGGSGWDIEDVWTDSAINRYGITNLYGDNGSIDDVITNFVVKDTGDSKAHTALFSYQRASEESANNEATIKAAYDFKENTTVDGDVENAINTVFKSGTTSYVSAAVRTEFQYFTKVWGATFNNFNYNGGVASDLKTGRNDYLTNLFPTSIYGTNGENFHLKSIDTVELFNLLNSPGQHSIIYAIPGCHNSQAIIQDVALQAKKNGYTTVYVYDGELSGSVRFGENQNAKTVATSTPNGWLGVRQSTLSISYLYGEFAKYLGTKLVTTNSSRGTSSIQYYRNGDVLSAGALTENPFSVTSAAGIGGATLTSDAQSDSSGLNNLERFNARRLQIPLLFQYNKAVPNSVNEKTEVIHKNNPASPIPTSLVTAFNGGNTYLEFMLEYVWSHPENAVDGGTAARNSFELPNSTTGSTNTRAAAYVNGDAATEHNGVFKLPGVGINLANEAKAQIANLLPPIKEQEDAAAAASEVAAAEAARKAAIAKELANPKTASSATVNDPANKAVVKITAKNTKIKKGKTVTIKATKFTNAIVKTVKLDKKAKKLKLKVTKTKNGIKVKGKKKGKAKITITLANGNKKTIKVTIK